MVQPQLVHKSPEIERCINALERGICQYAGISKVAAIICDYGNSQSVISDRHNILKPHISSLFGTLGMNVAPKQIPIIFADHQYYSNGGTLTQAWFVETRRDISSPVLSEWLKIAANTTELTIVNSTRAPMSQLGSQLESGAKTAISEYVKSKGIVVDVGHILQQLARCSTATEEGKRASGQLAFFNMDQIRGIKTKQQQILVELVDPISLNDYKHVVKSLQITSSGNYLAGTSVDLTYVLTSVPADCLVANFRKGNITLTVGTESICRIINGDFFFPIDPTCPAAIKVLTQHGVPTAATTLVKSIISDCYLKRHGATVVLSDQKPKITMSGHELKNTLASASNLAFISSMSGVDGALFVDFNADLHGFGYLLDGGITQGVKEKRSRGARYNSALRFSHKVKDAVVIVVSEDGPITIFLNGKEIYSDPLAQPFPFIASGSGFDLLPDLKEWHEEGSWKGIQGIR